MKVGDIVICYRHEGLDLNHNCADSPAIVTDVWNEADEVLGLVVFPSGGPVQFVRVGRWNPEIPDQVVGGLYWREAGEDPPDLAAYFNPPEPEKEEPNA